jgi:branched-chain amino acid transport system ATP-binding protein
VTGVLAVRGAEGAAPRTAKTGREEHATMIEVSDLEVRQRGAIALDKVNLRVGTGEMVALVGPTGAGKSTLVKALSRIVRPWRGTVTVRGRLAQVPQGRRLFCDLTVEENLRLGGRRIRNRDTTPVYEALPALIPLRHERAATLTHGEQQLTAVGRALMRQPDVLVIDELTLGYDPILVADLVDYLRALNRRTRLAVLLVEHNAKLALDLCSRAYLMEGGRIVAEGDSATLAARV